MKTELIQRWMELVEYRISEGSEFGWQCFGPDAYRLDHWNGESQNSPSFSITFDRRNQTVYQIEANDYVNDRAYRWSNPESADAYIKEAEQRGVGAKEAWDDVDYIELDSVDDFFEKATAIYRGEDYDTRVTVTVEFTDEELLKYMTMAHERDMTFNQFIEEALKAAIEEHKRDPEGMKQRAQQWKHKTDVL
jgi:hypothetical protein